MNWILLTCSLLVMEIPLERYTFDGVEMAVPVRMVLYAESQEVAQRGAAAAFERFGDLNRRLSDYDEASEIRQFCDFARPGRFVCVSVDLWNVLREAVRAAEETDGAFDPTVGQVVRLWRHARKAKKMPPAERLQRALETVDYRKILWDEKTRAIALSQPGARLDLGGIAKGYAIDEALKTLEKLGITRALVDAGGDVGVSGPPPGKKGWMVAVSPMKKGEKPSEFLTLSHRGVANSGDMYQFVTLSGKRYSHLVNPQTGLGLTHRAMVSVIAQNATVADALASAISVMGPEKGFSWAKRHANIEVQILWPDSRGVIQRLETEGFRR
ncbi:MAG: FAD:protein FMN transferase [Planctomycetia bacterium]|nr:FAD:protein FMN transferase [Planctomycetia bacterium]